MSRSAPWFSLSCDWSESEMFDDSAMGVRLAWVELLSVAKAQGRAGKLRLRVSKFVEQKRLTTAAVEEMLDRASSGPKPAIKRQGDEIVIINWKIYQDPKHRSKNDLESNGNSFTKTFPTSTQNPDTNHQAPATHHQGQSFKTPEHRAPPSGTLDSGFSKKDRGRTLGPAIVADPILYGSWIETDSRLNHGLTKSDESKWLAWLLRARAVRDSEIDNPTGFIKAGLLALRRGDREKSFGCVAGSYDELARDDKAKYDQSMRRSLDSIGKGVPA